MTLSVASAADQAVFPGAEPALRRLVDQHLTDNYQKLLLAAYYAPQRDSGDVFFFEVFENFGSGEIDDDRKIFEVTHGRPAGFDLNPQHALHMLFTHVPELRQAINENWPAIEELRLAHARGAAKVLYRDADHPALWDMIVGK